jgi:hypothetical protein
MGEGASKSVKDGREIGGATALYIRANMTAADNPESGNDDHLSAGRGMK